ncbi:MAG: hypothetical protein P1V35_00830 [Planctomycetota bacterium]|nr:hypothetical protein [Planctomycetota bacterium]
MGMHHEIHPTWTLILGMGPSSAVLEPLLAGMTSSHGSVRLQVLDGAVPTLPAPTRRGRLVLSAQGLEGSHVALVEQFLAQASGWELVLLDVDGSPCMAQRLVGPAHVYWWPGPLLVEQIGRLFHPPRPRDSAQLAEPNPAPEIGLAPPESVCTRRKSPLQFTDPDEELGAIQAILSAPFVDEEEDAWDAEPSPNGLEESLESFDFEEFPADEPNYSSEREEPDMHFPVPDPFAVPDTAWAQPPSSAPQSTSEHPVDVLTQSLASGPMVRLEEVLAEERAEALLPRSETDWQRMSWYKGQIADLNDLAQRLHLDLFALEEDVPLQGHPIAMALREDVARLSQFARTLGFLASPPAQGEQTFSLATLVQEQLGALTGLGPDAPRFLFRGQTQAQVRSDKMLLVSALDALLQVAGQCAGSQSETVRVECLDLGEIAQIKIGFRAGPIADLTPEEIFEPYALRPHMADIGPNALSAARSILRGQGGDLQLEVPDSGDCAFLLNLPLAH